MSEYTLINTALIRPSKGLSAEAVLTFQPMVKKPSVVFIKHISEPFTVLTESGPVTMKEGGYLCHDPVAGRFWPIDQLYLELHYRSATQEELILTAAETVAAGHVYPEPESITYAAPESLPSEPPA